jgi:hypothetical protein
MLSDLKCLVSNQSIKLHTWRYLPHCLHITPFAHLEKKIVSYITNIFFNFQTRGMNISHPNVSLSRNAGTV